MRHGSMLIVLCVVATICAGPALADTAGDVAVLNGSATTAAEKAAAAWRLGRAPRDDHWPAVIAALSKATGHADEVVRRAAQDALGRVVGPAQAAKLEAEFRPGGKIPAGERVGPDGFAVPPEVIAAINWPAIAPRQSAAEMLLDPALPASVYPRMVRLLTDEPLGPGSALEPLVRAGAWPGVRGLGARLTMGTILGSQDAADAAVVVGAVPAGSTFYEEGRRAWVDRLNGWRAYPLAVVLATGGRAELRDVGLAMLEKVVEMNRDDRSRDGQARLRVAAELWERGTAGRQPVRLAAWEPADAVVARAIEEGWVERIAEARRGGKFDVVTLSACQDRLDSEIPESRKVAHEYWRSMFDEKGKLKDEAGTALALLLDSHTPYFNAIAGHLKTASPKVRAYGETRLLIRAGRGYLDAAGAVREWGLAETPLGRVALRVAQEKPGSVHRQWFEAAMSGRTEAAGQVFAEAVASGDEASADAIAYLAALAPERLGTRDALLAAAARGVMPSTRALELLAPKGAAADGVAKALGSTDPGTREVSLRLLTLIGRDRPETRAAVEPFLRSAIDRERELAAEVLGTDDARRTAAGPGVLRDLRAGDPAVRSKAAHLAHRLGLDRPAVTAALVKAVDSGDMATREGLVLALERAAAARAGSAVDVLATADEEKDVTKRAYLRAARRAVGK
ncbi:MAG TPA: hypothetical protein VEA69_21975 [Tepidisphaeraceae bacterium]|nr:hypothetical protein [Tepidisphaeraceae bacterium]